MRMGEQGGYLWSDGEEGGRRYDRKSRRRRNKKAERIVIGYGRTMKDMGSMNEGMRRTHVVHELYNPEISTANRTFKNKKKVLCKNFKMF